MCNASSVHYSQYLHCTTYRRSFTRYHRISSGTATSSSKCPKIGFIHVGLPAVTARTLPRLSLRALSTDFARSISCLPLIPGVHRVWFTKIIDFLWTEPRLVFPAYEETKCCLLSRIHWGRLSRDMKPKCLCRGPRTVQARCNFVSSCISIYFTFLSTFSQSPNPCERWTVP